MLGRPKAGVEARLRAQKIEKVRLGVLLLLVAAFRTSQTSSSLLIGTAF